MVVSEEGDVMEAQEKRDDFFVLHSNPSRIAPDLADRDAELAKQIALVVGEVLIEQIHAVTSSRVRVRRGLRSRWPRESRKAR